MKRPLLALTLFLAIGGTALAADMPIKKSGKTLVDSSGMTLYTFDKDAAGKSACNGACASNWPPLMADADAKATGKFSIITREDGTRQWAHDGKPLYRYKSDKKAGDRSGDNFKEMWHAAHD